MLALAVLLLGLWGPPQVIASGAAEPPPAATAPAATAPAATAPAATAPRLERVRLAADPSLQPLLLDALGLRMAPVPVVPHDTATAAGEGLEVYVHVPAPTDERYRVEIIVSDGRAYAREIAAPAAMAGRILGGELALLLRGIEEGTLVPDREDAVIPDEQAVEDAGRVEEDVAPERPAPAPAPTAARTASPRPAPRLQLGLFAGSGGSLGVAPGTDVAASAVASGELGLELRWPSGGAMSADVRMGGRRPTPFSVIRTRIAVGGGYVLRRGRLELPLRLWLGVEPWGVRTRGRSTAVMPIDGAARRVPLLGVAVRAEPGVRVPWPARPLLALRVGPYVELAGSAVWSNGVGVPRLMAADNGDVIARLGGLELGLGLCVQLWLDVGESPPRGRVPRAAP
jgi:hypothetical protein